MESMITLYAKFYYVLLTVQKNYVHLLIFLIIYLVEFYFILHG